MEASNFFQNIRPMSQNQAPKANAHKNEITLAQGLLGTAGDDLEAQTSNQEPTKMSPQQNI